MITRLLIAACVLALCAAQSQAGQGATTSQRLTVSKVLIFKTKKLKQRRMAKFLDLSQEHAGGGGKVKECSLCDVAVQKGQADGVTQTVDVSNLARRVQIIPAAAKIVPPPIAPAVLVAIPLVVLGVTTMVFPPVPISAP